MKMDKAFRTPERDDSGKKKVQPVEKGKDLKKTVFKEIEEEDDLDYDNRMKKDSILNYYDDGNEEDEEDDDDWDEEEEEEDDEDWEEEDK